MPKAYLYIPFSEAEDNSNLQIKAIQWVQAQKRRINPKEVRIIVHKESKFEAKDNEEIRNGVPVYILMHGVSNETEKDLKMLNVVCNTDNYFDETVSFITCGVVGQRVAEDGLLAKSNPRVKLFSCNMEGAGRAEKLAEDFIQGLPKEFHQSHTTVDCYNAILTGPSDQLIGPHKGAYRSLGPGEVVDQKKVIRIPGAELTLKEKPKASENRTRLSASRSVVLAAPPKKKRKEKTVDDLQKKQKQYK